MMLSQLQELVDITQAESSIKFQVDRIHQLRLELNELISDDEKLMVTGMIKSRVQREAEDYFDKAGGWGAILGATGVGKSKIAVDLVGRLLSIMPFVRVLLVVPTEKLRDEGWHEEFKKWGAEEAYNKIERCCYASLSKYEDGVFHFVILDEGHNITPNNAKFFHKNIIHSCLWLSATKPKDKLKIETLKEIGINPIYEITLDEAVKLGLVAPYEITVVTMYLDTVSKYIECKGKKGKFFQTEKRKYIYLSNLIFERPSKANRIKRARFIYNLKSKTHIAKLILDNVIPPDIRTIIFCESIRQAEEVCPNTYHSKSTDADLILFKEKMINRLACVQALNEGENIEELDCAFIIQLNSNPIDLIQRIGRTIRYRPDHTAKIIILCVEDSVDKDWVMEVTKSLTSNIKYVELSRLRLGLESIQF